MSKITVEEMSDSLKNYLNQQTANAISEYVEDKFSKKNNTKYETVGGYKEFSCVDGYASNIHMDGITLVNIGPMNNINGADADGIVRTRFKKISEANDIFANYKRYSGGVFTLYNFTNKSIQYVGRNSSDEWRWSQVVGAMSCKVVNMPADHCIVGVDFRPVDGWSNADLSIYNSSMYMVLEGDHSDKNLSYFKGIYSLGQPESINVMTLSNNLFDKNDFRLGSTMSTVDMKFEIDSRTTRITHKTPIPVNMYDYLALDFDRSLFKIYVYELDENDVILQAYHWNVSYFIRSITPGTKYIRCIFAYSDDREMTMNDYDKIRPYLAMKNDTKSIRTTLRSLPNGVCDTIEMHNGKYYKIERCKERTLYYDSSDWSLNENNGTTLQFKTKDFDDIKDFDALFFCDTEACTKGAAEELGIKIGGYEKKFYYRLMPNRLATANLTGFKTWLKSNPITVVYELANHNIIELPNFDPRVFEGTTTLLARSGGLKANVSFEVVNDLSNEIETLKDKVSSLDNSINENKLTVYSMDLLNGVEATGNNIYGVLQYNDCAVLTAELNVTTELTYGKDICRLHVVPKRAFYPIQILIINTGTCVEGWLYADGIIRTLGTIPAGTIICFTAPILI